MFVHATTYTDTTSELFALTSSMAAILECFGMMLASMVGMHISLLDASDRQDEVGAHMALLAVKSDSHVRFICTQGLGVTGLSFLCVADSLLVHHWSCTEAGVERCIEVETINSVCIDGRVDGRMHG
mmetsp:Transcript_74908/g.242174  ORF Transcript_74908/g.242174 Transcript_74908/m.242174 type:complete len:127 (+) Transcript_74908:171-551(+)